MGIFLINNFKDPIEYRRIFICLHVICFSCFGSFVPRSYAETDELGAERVTEGKTFLGRFSEDYANWGEVDYPRQIGITNNLKNYYSLMGDPLVYGSESIRWVERRGIGVQRYRGSNGSILNESLAHGQSGASFARLFNYVVVGSDGTDAWQSRFIYANEIRTRLTPLTLKMSNLNGVRVDVATDNDNFSALFSRLHAPIYSSGREGDHIIKAKTMLFGAHYERSLGFMNFGATFVNAHQYEPLMEQKALSMKGVPGAIQNAPALLAIRVSDDSPSDEKSGPVIHSISVRVNGQIRPEVEPFIVRLNKRGDDRQSYMAGRLRSGDRKPLPPLANDYQSINRGSSYNTYDPYINYAAFDVDVYYRGYEFPFWIDHLFYRDYKMYGADHIINQGRVENDGEDEIIVDEQFAHELVEESGQWGFSTLSDLPQAFNGSEYAMVYVDLEPLGEFIESVEVDLTVANDYHVELSEIDIAGSAPNVARSNYRDRYRYASYFRTIARAKGNPQNNVPKVVRVHSGVPTGLNLYSLNAYGVLKGFEINAEFSRSKGYYQYASGAPGTRVPIDGLSVNALQRELMAGHRSSIADNAYYVTMKRDAENWAIGAEYFSMGPHYTTEFRSYIGRDEQDVSGNPIAYNNTMIHRLIEDNDDDDRYPDSWYNNAPSGLQGQSDVDGIFPGLDEDNDGIPDTNKNFNAIPDYQEPFLMYLADPPVYDFGEDSNHNDVIDSRENDIYADLPYEKDTRGLHAYARISPFQKTFFTLGIKEAKQIAGSSPDKSLYTQVGYQNHVPSFGSFVMNASVERIQDGVEDDLSVYSDRVLTVAEQFELDFAGLQRNIKVAPFLEEPREDPMLFLNSTRTRLYADTKWGGINTNWKIRNKVKFEINRQHEGEIFDGRSQGENRISRWTMVHAVDHNWPIASKLNLFTGFKFRYRREWDSQSTEDRFNEHHIIPMAKLRYSLTERTRFHIGLQGLGLLVPYSVTDSAHPVNSFEQFDLVAMFSNDSKYFGYVVSTNAGISRRTKNYETEEVSLIGDEDFVAAFVNVIVGFEAE
jgi:hypothetical protein